MVRDSLSKHLVAPEPHFQWRGSEVTRLEGFTDAVFAFAVTLIVVSLEVPRTFADLAVAMRGFVAFAICFGILVRLWHAHYVYSRRYGLQTSYSVLLNTVLLFVVLFYVYPLKFLFTVVTGNLFGAGPVTKDSAHPVITAVQVPTLMLVFSLGYMTVFGVLALMYRYAYGKRGQLRLNGYEVLRTRYDMWLYTVVAATGALVAIAAEVLPARVSFLSIFLTLLGPLYRASSQRLHRDAERLALEQSAHGEEIE